MNIVKLNTREHHNILRFLSHTTLIEKKVFLNIAYELNKLKPSDYEGLRLYPLEIPMEKLMERTEANYKAIGRICDKLTSKKYKLKVDMKLKSGKIETGTLTGVFFPECFISDNVFKVEIMTTLLPYFCRQLKKYRNYNIIEAKFLKHKHSIEMYKYLKDKLNQKKQSLTISIEDFKYELGLENRYKEYRDFKHWVLNPTKEDLKNNSVLYFDYLEQKTGRKVTDLIISIHQNGKKEQEIYKSERIRAYIKSTPTENFKKDFQHFLEEEFCCSSYSKTLLDDEYDRELKKLSKRDSLAGYPKKVQELFIDFLEPPLPL